MKNKQIPCQKSAFLIFSFILFFLQNPGLFGMFQIVDNPGKGGMMEILNEKLIKK